MTPFTTYSGDGDLEYNCMLRFLGFQTLAHVPQFIPDDSPKAHSIH